MVCIALVLARPSEKKTNAQHLAELGARTERKREYKAFYGSMYQIFGRATDVCQPTQLMYPVVEDKAYINKKRWRNDATRSSKNNPATNEW